MLGKPSIGLILGEEVTESEVECQNSFVLHRLAASREDGWLPSFFIVNLLFYFDTLFF